MLPDHDSIHRRRILKREEREAPRTTSSIAHDRTRFYLPELREVLAETLCHDALFSTTKQGTMRAMNMYVPSVVSQFRPPMNIFLMIAGIDIAKLIERGRSDGDRT